MSAGFYRRSLALVLAHEGGYLDHPKDPGGPTNKGITQKTYDAYRKVKGLPLQSVKLLSSTETDDIYKRQFWSLVHADDLPAGLDYAVFDFAVNSGVSRAVRYLQLAVGIQDDGVLGQQSLAAVYASAKVNEEALILTYCANRLAFMKSLATFAIFGLGWTRRVVGMSPGVQMSDNGVLDVAIGMARADDVYTMPPSIGSLPGEVSAKAVASEEAKDLFPMATPDDLAKLAAQNDALAGIIALGKLA